MCGESSVVWLVRQLRISVPGRPNFGFLFDDWSGLAVAGGMRVLRSVSSAETRKAMFGGAAGDVRVCEITGSGLGRFVTPREFRDVLKFRGRLFSV